MLGAASLRFEAGNGLPAWKKYGGFRVAYNFDVLSKRQMDERL